ncbi:MAG: DUF2066 domain-containing protein [Hyphomonadaceae bacterium]
MKATPLAAFAAVLVAALCAFAPGAASAQVRDNVYAVGGVYVDETAANAADAQEAAFAAAQRTAYERLVRRLTLPDQLVSRGMPAAEGVGLDRLVLSVDVEEQRRSSTRYIGRLTVRFDPASFRAVLRGWGLTVIDTRTSPVLVAPTVASGTSDETAALWREVWNQGGFGDELVPLVTAPPTLNSAPSWDVAAPYAQSAAATSALFANLRIQGGVATATLIEMGPAVRLDRGEVVARIEGTDSSAFRTALASLAEQASMRVQSDWKTRVATGAGQQARVSASAIYTDQRQWESIKQALEGAAQTVISEIRIEAVARQGALISFSYSGERAQLAAELARRGVTLEDTQMGPVLRVARR